MLLDRCDEADRAHGHAAGCQERGDQAFGLTSSQRRQGAATVPMLLGFRGQIADGPPVFLHARSPSSEYNHNASSSRIRDDASGVFQERHDELTGPWQTAVLASAALRRGRAVHETTPNSARRRARSLLPQSRGSTVMRQSHGSVPRPTRKRSVNEVICATDAAGRSCIYVRFRASPRPVTQSAPHRNPCGGGNCDRGTRGTSSRSRYGAGCRQPQNWQTLASRCIGSAQSGHRFNAAAI